jgi:phosphatidylethanolamine-binding protein (PEBP) family uncharacterized protein
MAAKSTKKRSSRPRFTLTSPDFRANGTIGMEQVYNGFGCSGENISPALKWTGAPAQTKSFALYALKTERLDVGLSGASLAGYMVNANAIGRAQLTGKFGRKK